MARSPSEAVAAAAAAAAAVVAPTAAARLRNVAIIAHVDHGKTTLVDRLLQACNETLVGERVMDSNALETERGITILAKCTSVRYGDYDINIVDTPGHADFGGEVERILGMVDSVVLLVDATEGCMTQTKFVLNKALRSHLRPLVVFNKVDRESSRIGEVENEIFDLFALLGADDAQLDFPTLYASARQGWAVRNLTTDPRTSMRPLLDAIVQHVPAPTITTPADAPFGLVVTMIQRDNWLGRLVTGRIASGTVRIGDNVHAMTLAGQPIETGRITKIVKRRGVTRVDLTEAFAGDIVTLAGLSKVSVTDTVGSLALTAPLAAVPVDPPTVSMTFSVNDSPLAGRTGSKLTSQQIGERLRQEVETNVSLRVIESEERKEAFEVQGRGEMQLGVLIETMRREGFELSVSPPTVVYQEKDGVKMEPVEEVTIEVDEEYAGIVIEKLSLRRGDLTNMAPQLGGKTKLQLLVPSRGLIGYRAEFMVDTHGTGVMNRVVHGYMPYKGVVDKVRKGVLVSVDDGSATTYSLALIEPRGILFISPQEKVYEGMIIGEHTRDTDLDVNPVKTKRLTNVRTHAHDENIRLTPPRQFSLEEALGYVGTDELIEITPDAIRLRKRILDPNKRRTQTRKGG